MSWNENFLVTLDVKNATWFLTNTRFKTLMIKNFMKENFTEIAET